MTPPEKSSRAKSSRVISMIRRSLLFIALVVLSFMVLWLVFGGIVYSALHNGS